VDEADIAGLKSFGTSHFAVKTPEIKTSQKKSKNQTSPASSTAKIIISPETMLEILIFDSDTNWSGNLTLGRFTPEFSAEFKTLNAFGIHDAWFTGHFNRIIQRRLDPVFGSKIIGLDPANPLHSLLVETSHFSQDYGAGALERRTISIPGDLTKILTDIRARNPREFSEMVVKSAAILAILPAEETYEMKRGGGEFY
jgi:hypothetical protein